MSYALSVEDTVLGYHPGPSPSLGRVRKPGRVSTPPLVDEDEDEDGGEADGGDDDVDNCDVIGSAIY